MTIIHMKQHDLAFPVEGTLLHGEPAVPIDLNGCTVKFIMNDDRGNNLVAKPASVVGPGQDGNVQYDWSGDDTKIAGDMNAEWEVTLPSLKKVTVPNDDYIRIRITKDLA